MPKFQITKEAWIDLNKRQSKEEIKEYLHSIIESLPVDLPLRELSKDQAENSFRDLLSLNSASLIKKGECFTRYNYDWWREPLFYIDSTRIGNEASDYFHQKTRWKCDSINSPSPYRSWHNRKFRDGILNALWTLKVEEINDQVFRSAIGLRKYIASQFRPSAAKCIYEYFNAKNVLDFSSGWGDRLAGFYAAQNTQMYVGIDPNKALFPNYYKQAEMYQNILDDQLFSNKKKTIFVNDCAEDVKYSIVNVHDKFDLIFTSCPYFTVERYTQEDNQSWKRYRKLDQWLSKFLFKAIENAWNALEVNGHMLINISDVYANHQINKLCDPMNTLIQTLDGAEFKGIIGYRMSKRPNSESDKKGVFIEPMFLWKKLN
jgi:hypothetical protein